jgi:hypothetical protein
LATTKKAKGAPPRKKPVATKEPAPKPVSRIVLAAEEAIALNPTRAGAAAAVAVIEALIKRAGAKPEIVKFLTSALKAVKAGGGQDGGGPPTAEDESIKRDLPKSE